MRPKASSEHSGWASCPSFKFVVAMDVLSFLRS